MLFVVWKHYAGSRIAFNIANPFLCKYYGFEWVNEQLQARGRHDHRLETALAMMDRLGVVGASHPPDCFQLTAPLPARLVDQRALSDKLQRDREKLYALVEYVRESGDRKEFIRRYFGLAATGSDSQP